MQRGGSGLLVRGVRAVSPALRRHAPCGCVSALRLPYSGLNLSSSRVVCYRTMNGGFEGEGARKHRAGRPQGLQWSTRRRPFSVEAATAAPRKAHTGAGKSSKSGSASAERGVLGALRSLVEAGTLEVDAAQVAAARRLQRLWQRLAAYEEQFDRVRAAVDASRRAAREAAAVGGASDDDAPAAALNPATVHRPAQLPAAALAAPRGVFLHGPVGSGKTLLLDLLFAEAPTRRKRRAHFHAFMADCHARMHELRQSATPASPDPIEALATELADEAWLLCFDELQLTDIADALLLSRLLGHLLSHGVVIVATGNQPPSDLYREGLNRLDFVPFFEQLERHCRPVAVDSGVDYRTRDASTRGLSPLRWIDATSANATDLVRIAFVEASGGVPLDAAAPTTVPTEFGRAVSVPKAAGGAAYFTFDELCGRELSAVDYRALAAACTTLVVDGVPALGAAQHNEARRFVTLVDELYNAGTAVTLSTAVPLQQVLEAVAAAGRPGVVTVATFEDEKAPGADAKYGRSAAVPRKVLSVPAGAQGGDGGDADAATVVAGAGEGAAIADLALACARATSRLLEMTGQKA